MLKFLHIFPFLLILWVFHNCSKTWDASPMWGLGGSGVSNRTLTFKETFKYYSVDVTELHNVIFVIKCL